MGISKGINIHAGHNPANKTACGAVGILNESNEARNIVNEAMRLFAMLGVTAYNCTVDNGISKQDVLSKIVAKCNQHDVDYDLSVHLNAGRGDAKGDGQTGGVEVYIFSEDMRPEAERVCKEIAALGFRNRGVKIDKKLYVLKNTNAKAMLIECCFVDDADDAKLFDAYSMAKAIVKGITQKTIYEIDIPTDPAAAADGAETKTGDGTEFYRVQVGAFKNNANAEKLKAQLIAAGFQAFVTR